MISNVEAGAPVPFRQEAQGLIEKRVVIVGDSAVSRAVAALLAEQGARVFFAASTDEDLGDVLSAVATAKGESEGMVASRECPEEMRRFFTRAKRILGQVDVLICQPAGGGPLSDGVNQLVQLAIQHMRQAGGGHIISIYSAGGWAADLRRKARDSGIRVTRIEPSSSVFLWAGSVPGSDPTAEVARCIHESIVYPYLGDVIFLKDPFPGQIQ